MQRFIGSSENGIESVEARVRGLEEALDDISLNMCATSRSSSSACCSLPKLLWRNASHDHELDAASSGARRRGLVLNPLEIQISPNRVV
ncbi:hypothetical protein C2S52_011533 [Perilla frutescens var. hirtella]|nr:hypothetical protein C2S52_011533 [Perilla frutescens var. hirtella]KAH6785816.1 hypothetical protein C2S51_038271 [Perilla frutescens var. frutescens]